MLIQNVLSRFTASSPEYNNNWSTDLQ